MTDPTPGEELLQARKAFKEKPSYNTAIDVQVAERMWAQEIRALGAVPLTRR
jgi:hypothetical protein